jgi:hypothetical protein
VQGDGSTGYFDTNVSLITLGCSPSTGHISVLTFTDNRSISKFIAGAGTSLFSTNIIVAQQAPTGIRLRWSGLLDDINALDEPALGFITFNRQGGLKRISRRNSSQFSNLASEERVDVGDIPNSEFFFMSSNGTNTSGVKSPASLSDTQFGKFVIGLGMTDAQDAAFTLIAQQFYESLTGILIP